MHIGTDPTISTQTPTPGVWAHDVTNRMYRIPGRSYERGEITHKRICDMNRRERRAVAAAGYPIAGHYAGQCL